MQKIHYTIFVEYLKLKKRSAIGPIGNVFLVRWLFSSRARKYASGRCAELSGYNIHIKRRTPRAQRTNTYIYA